MFLLHVGQVVVVGGTGTAINQCKVNIAQDKVA